MTTPKQAKPAETRKHMDVPERKCIASGQIRPKDELLRFVVSPEGLIVLDIKQSLPGRGIWVSCSREDVELAQKKGLFARSAKQKVDVPDTLSNIIEKVLADKCLSMLGLSRKSGLLKTGFAKVEASLKAGKAAVLISAYDSATDGRQKLQRQARSLPLIEMFSIAELSQALGQENSVHVSMVRAGLTDKFLVEVSRLSGFRNFNNVGERTGSE